MIGSALVYGILTFIAVIILLLVKPVPDYFTQSIGSVKYRVPREFTMNQDSKFGVSIEICIETLKGIYDPNRGNCDYQQVTISTEPVQRAADPEFFFEQIDEFALDGDQVIFMDGSERYRVQSRDSLKSYTINTQWNRYPWADPQHDLPIHFQVNDQDKLIRFVKCSRYKYKDRVSELCKHSVKTTDGTLTYELTGSTDFDLELWQNTDRKILNLISQWKFANNNYENNK